MKGKKEKNRRKTRYKNLNKTKAKKNSCHWYAYTIAMRSISATLIRALFVSTISLECAKFNRHLHTMWAYILFGCALGFYVTQISDGLTKCNPFQTIFTSISLFIGRSLTCSLARSFVRSI